MKMKKRKGQLATIIMLGVVVIAVALFAMALAGMRVDKLKCKFESITVGMEQAPTIYSVLSDRSCAPGTRLSVAEILGTALSRGVTTKSEEFIVKVGNQQDKITIGSCITTAKALKYIEGDFKFHVLYKGRTFFEMGTLAGSSSSSSPTGQVYATTERVYVDKGVVVHRAHIPVPAGQAGEAVGAATVTLLTEVR